MVHRLQTSFLQLERNHLPRCVKWVHIYHSVQPSWFFWFISVLQMKIVPRVVFPLLTGTYVTFASRTGAPGCKTLLHCLQNCGALKHKPLLPYWQQFQVQNKPLHNLDLNDMFPLCTSPVFLFFPVKTVHLVLYLSDGCLPLHINLNSLSNIRALSPLYCSQKQIHAVQPFQKQPSWLVTVWKAQVELIRQTMAQSQQLSQCSNYCH